MAGKNIYAAEKACVPGGVIKQLVHHFACLLVFCASVFAQTHKSSVGIWKFDPAQSDLGTGPGLKSDTITVLKDAPQMFSWRVNGADADGKPFDYSWHGPENGSMHPVISKNGGQEKQSAKKEQDGSIVRHGEQADGSSFDARCTITDDGNTMIEEVTAKSKDGKETKQKYVFKRVQGKAAN